MMSVPKIMWLLAFVVIAMNTAAFVHVIRGDGPVKYAQP